MIVLDRDAIAPAFIIVWIALAVISLALFQFSRNATRKRRLFPWAVAFSSALFIGFMFAFGVPWVMVLGMTPFVLLIGWMNLRITRFCDSCGRTVTSGIFSRARFCPHCGAALE